MFGSVTRVLGAWLLATTLCASQEGAPFALVCQYGDDPGASQIIDNTGQLRAALANVSAYRLDQVREDGPLYFATTGKAADEFNEHLCVGTLVHTSTSDSFYNYDFDMAAGGASMCDSSPFWIKLNSAALQRETLQFAQVNTLHFSNGRQVEQNDSSRCRVMDVGEMETRIPRIIELLNALPEREELKPAQPKI